MTGRRFFEQVKTVTAGGGFDSEWFRYRSMPTAEDIRAMQKAEGTAFDQGFAMAFQLLKSWSFTTLIPKNPDFDPIAKGEELPEDEILLHYNREPLPVTFENLMLLPVECVMPLLEVVGDTTNFLKQKSEMKSDSTS